MASHFAALICDTVLKIYVAFKPNNEMYTHMEGKKGSELYAVF